MSGSPVVAREPVNGAVGVCVMEVLNPSGHVTLQWDPYDAASVKKAEAEFEKMREAGFAFFASASVDADKVEELEPAVGALDGRLEQVRTFRGRARRTTAVPPMRGGPGPLPDGWPSAPWRDWSLYARLDWYAIHGAPHATVFPPPPRPERSNAPTTKAKARP